MRTIAPPLHLRGSWWFRCARNTRPLCPNAVLELLGSCTVMPGRRPRSLGGAGYGLEGWVRTCILPILGMWSAWLGSRGVVETIQKTLASRQEGLSTWAEAMSFRWQGSKAEPSSPRGPPTAPPQSQPRKGHRHKKTFATLLIYSGFLPLSQWATSCRTPE